MSALIELDALLDAEETDVVFATVWEVFTAVAEVCHQIAFDEGSDELEAMLAGQKCGAARDRLPLPVTGEPVVLAPPDPGAQGLDPFVRLLRHAGEALERLLATADSVSEDAERSLREAVALAGDASAALSQVRVRS
ncbi:hypothetical protein ACFXKW_37495 [Streptomyces sp. NPDC059193]|uniref:hypothetical protein n=1 Tax=Streptomyces sp. NPDC059193 TaxID=3346763 RepID=UPI0036A63EBD